MYNKNNTANNLPNWQKTLQNNFSTKTIITAQMPLVIKNFALKVARNKSINMIKLHVKLRGS